MKNLKDLLTTVFGILGTLSGIVLSLPTDGKIITPDLKIIAGVVASFSVGIIGFMTGKNPDGSTKVINPVTGQQNVDPNSIK